MSPRAVGIAICLLVLSWAIVACIVKHETERRSLRRYRPTFENRFPHRDEFRVMRDCK